MPRTRHVAHLGTGPGTRHEYCQQPTADHSRALCDASATKHCGPDRPIVTGYNERTAAAHGGPRCR